jgi:multiple sugar transport system ATP-binding protein
MASVHAVNLRKRFGDLDAVAGLGFEVPDGSFFSLLGPPGAGKTTALRIIAGLEKADEGEVWLGDQLVNAVHPKDRDVAMVFEDLALYPHWTGFDNLAHPLKLRKVPPAELSRRVQEVAERLHIRHLLERRPGTYSGGERRRLAIGRALVRQPRVLLLDEPLTDLDAKIRQEMTAELKRLQSDTGQTMIYATHDFEEAMGMADHILVIDHGKGQQTAPPQEVYERPVNAFVAGFVGSPAMNLIPCQTSLAQGKLRLEHPAFQLTIRPDGEPPKEVLLGVRPEHIQLADSGDARGIPARVDIQQVLGDEQILDLSLGDGSLLKAVLPLKTALEPGHQVLIRLPASQLFLFERASGAHLKGPGIAEA